MITVLFIIIGLKFLVVANNENIIIISILWLMSIILLMIMVIHSSIAYYKNSWIFTNALFLYLLIMSSFWAGEFNNNDDDSIKTISGILIILGGLLMCSLATNKFNNFFCTCIFWISVCYILIWFSLTLYVTI